MLARRVQVAPASADQKTNLFHMDCSMSSASTKSTPVAERSRPNSWSHGEGGMPREPVVSREPTPVREPSAPSAPTRSLLRPPVAEPRAVEPPPEPSVAPEPVVAPRATDKPAEAPEEVVRNSAEFSSLEDEMARLLDDLAGDSKGKR